MRVVLTVIGSLGDLHPFLGLSIELQKRGHNVTLLTSPYHRERVEQAGIAFHPIGPNFQLDDLALVDAILDPLRGPEILHKKYVFPYVRECMETLLPFAKNADFVVSGVLSYYARIVSELTGTPWVSCLLSPFCFWSRYDPPILAPIPWLGRARFLGPSFHRFALDALFLASAHWAKPLHALRRELKLPRASDPFRSGQYSERLVLAPFSPLLAAPQKDWPAQARATGFIFYDGHGENASISPELDNFLTAGDPPLVLTLGSTCVERPGQLYDRFIHVARALNKRLVILAGKNHIERFTPLAGRDVFVGDYAPYIELFPRAAAIIHQGGVGTTARAMRSGRPMLVLPACMDQFDNAERVKRRNIANLIPLKKFSERRATEALDRLLGDPEVLAAATETGAAVRAENGAVSAAEALESR